MPRPPALSIVCARLSVGPEAVARLAPTAPPAGRRVAWPGGARIMAGAAGLSACRRFDAFTLDWRPR